MFFPRWLVTSFSLLVVSSASAAPVAEWNVLFYLNGKNSLQHEMQEFLLKNLHAMRDVNHGKDQAVELPEGVNVLVEYGTIRPDCDESSSEDRELDLCKSGVKRFRMQSGDVVAAKDSEFADLGHADMGDVETLVDFVDWSKARFPSKRTVLYVFDHGSNYSPTSPGLFSFDDESGHAMDSSQIAKGFREMAGALGRPVDLFITDMCEVGSVEALGQMAGSLRYYVASRDNVKGYSINVIEILGLLAKYADLTPKRFAYQVTLQANRYTPATYFSAFALDRLPDLGDSTGKLIDAIRSLPSDQLAAFRQHFLGCPFQSIGHGESVDFRDVLSCLYRFPGMKDCPEYQAVERAFYDLMFTNSSDIVRSGLAIWGRQAARNASPIDADAIADYRKLEWGRLSRWSDFLVFLSKSDSQ